MKVLLFNSPIYEVHTEVKEKYLPPLGLAYIASQIAMSGIEVRIVDCVNLHYGREEIYEVLIDEKPDYIGFNIFTQNYEIVKKIVEDCPIDTKIMIGGQVVKCIYEEILDWDVRNQLIIIIGEGELIIPQIVQNCCKETPIKCKIKSSVYRVDKDSLYYPKNLDEVHIDRTLLSDDITVNHYNQKEAAIITSRGCIYNCAFCGGAHNLNKDVTIRYRTIEDIDKEITEITKMHPEVSSIRVLDDLFLRDDKSMDDAITLFSKYPNISWRGMAHVLSFEKVNNDVYSKLQKSGCRELFLGIESGSCRIRKKINKMGTPDQIIKVITSILQSGIDVKGYFMFGFPGENDEDADKTFKLAQNICMIAKETTSKFRLSVFQFRPYHGTKLYKEIVDSGRVISSIKSNEELNVFENRTQFNFQSGNYSDITDEKLNEYIIKTQKLSENIECD